MVWVPCLRWPLWFLGSGLDCAGSDSWRAFTYFLQANSDSPIWGQTKSPYSLPTDAKITRAHTCHANTNRTSNGAPTGITTATFAANSNRLATINGVAVTLDAAGNLTQEGSYTYGWNEAGLLQTVSKAGSLVATYTYDHRNRRTRKLTTPAAPQGAQTVVYHYDQADRLIGETRGDGTPLRTYVWLEERPMAVMEHAALSTPPRTLYLQLDHLDTPRLARDAAGTIHWRWDSDGYGSAAATEDPDGNGKATVINLRFPGQYYDQESGLHYNWNRYYSPRAGEVYFQ